MKDVGADRQAEERTLAAEFKKRLAGLDRYIPATPAFPSIERRSRIRWAPGRRGSASDTARLGVAASAAVLLVAFALAGSWGFGRLNAPGESMPGLSEASAQSTTSPADTPEVSPEASATASGATDTAGPIASAPADQSAAASPSVLTAAWTGQPDLGPIPTMAPRGQTSTAPWYASEVYYLNLMNCTRTGGWVTSDGSCSAATHHTLPAQAPLVLDAGMSEKVARPYAKLLADTDTLTHYLNDTTTRSRLCDWGGYCSGSAWGENVASPGSPGADGMTAVELFYQNEAFCSCQHYSNVMNPAFHRVGIGVWVSSGTVRVVVDFYE
jgi:uncharacterized protein YkwD